MKNINMFKGTIKDKRYYEYLSKISYKDYFKTIEEVLITLHGFKQTEYKLNYVNFSKDKDDIHFELKHIPVPEIAMLVSDLSFPIYETDMDLVPIELSDEEIEIEVDKILDKIDDYKMESKNNEIEILLESYIWETMGEDEEDIIRDMYFIELNAYIDIIDYAIEEFDKVIINYGFDNKATEDMYNHITHLYGDNDKVYFDDNYNYRSKKRHKDIVNKTISKKRLMEYIRSNYIPTREEYIKTEILNYFNFCPKTYYVHNYTFDDANNSVDFTIRNIKNHEPSLLVLDLADKIMDSIDEKEILSAQIINREIEEVYWHVRGIVKSNFPYIYIYSNLYQKLTDHNNELIKEVLLEIALYVKLIIKLSNRFDTVYIEKFDEKQSTNLIYEYVYSALKNNNKIKFVHELDDNNLIL